MNIRQQKFADSILEGKTGVQAAIDAGYSEASAYVQSSCLLRNPNIKRYIDDRRRRTAEKADVTLEWTMKRLADEAQNAPDAKDRVRALELLAKAQGAFVERSEVSVHGDATIIAARAENLLKKAFEAEALAQQTPEPLALLDMTDDDTEDEK